MGRKTVSFSASHRIERPADEVFSFLADLEQHPTWQSEPSGAPLRKEVLAEHVSGPRVGKGAAYRWEQVLMGKRTELRLETAEYEPPRRLAFRSKRFGLAFDLEPTDDGGTRVICTREYSVGPVQRLMLRRPYAEASIREDLEKVARALAA